MAASSEGTTAWRDVVVVGGCGRVGLPLGLALAQCGLHVSLYDRNPQAVDAVNRGELPFDEPGGAAILAKVIGRNLVASIDPSCVADAEYVVVVVGTPVDEYQNPLPGAVPAAIEELMEHIVDGQVLVLRSTLYPGVTAMVERLIATSGKRVNVTYCPERIAEGKALTELATLPQIVASRSEQGADRAAKLFRNLTSEIIELSPEEAELAKLFTNTWRYIRFAAANQFYAVANEAGLDFEVIRSAMRFQYPRAADLPAAGLAAGPCLLKDTLQLAAYTQNNLSIGQSAMQVNEGLPLYLVRRIESRYDLSSMTVGLLGMAFKAESDDNRASLSYKLKRVLKAKAARVLTTDPYVTTDPNLTPLAEVLEQADLLVIATPHRAYADISPSQPVIDVWNLYGRGVQV